MYAEVNVKQCTFFMFEQPEIRNHWLAIEKLKGQ